MENPDLELAKSLILPNDASLPNDQTRLAIQAVLEWILFDFGKIKEDTDPGYMYVAKYWKFLYDEMEGKKEEKEWLKDLDGLNDNYAWSAAFISYIIHEVNGYTKTYEKFKYSAGHCFYVLPALQQQQGYPFKGHDTEKRRYQPQLGDLICCWREKKFSYKDLAEDSCKNLKKKEGFRKSHCDVVVCIKNDYLITIGGNVRNSVSITKYTLDKKGFVPVNNTQKIYAILQNVAQSPSS